VVRKLLPWRRELGIGMFVAAGLHVAIYLNGGLNPLDFIRFPNNDFGESGLIRDQAAAANWVGLVALAYALALAATSNRFAQRRLGRGWKFLQQQAYTLFVLAVLHVAGFLYLAYDSPGGFKWWFWTFAALTVTAQFAGYVRTVWTSKGPAPERIPRTRKRGSVAARTAVAKGTVIAALWIVLVARVYTMGTSSAA
jgi:DMSO/TMAO reductase YedYZ heme-binding membrane subunit